MPKKITIQLSGEESIKAAIKELEQVQKKELTKRPKKPNACAKRGLG